MTAWPIPRASSGNFFAPNRTRTISRMTIKSGPAKFMKLAMRLISTANIRPFLRVARNFSEADELPAEDRLRLTDKALWESIPSYASHLERQRQLRSSDLSPIRYKKVAEADSKEVPADQIVKGFEFERGHYVVMKDEDFEKVRIESTHSIDITDFDDLEQVDPKFFYKPYFLEPQKGGEKAYAVLHKALSGTGKIGIAKVVISNREHLAAVKPDGLFMILELMHFASEILGADVLKNGSATAVTDKELKMAQALIESMSDSWEPEKYRDEYRTALMEIIEQKAQHKEIPTKAPAAPAPTNVVDLVKVLQESLNRTESLRQKRSAARSTGRRSTSALVKQRRRAGALG